MKRYSVVVVIALLLLIVLSNSLVAQNGILPDKPPVQDNPSNLPYNFPTNSDLLEDSTRYHSPLMMEDPDIMKQEVVYDSKQNGYVIRNTVGGIEYKPPSYLSIEDYLNYDIKTFKNNYWKQRARSENFEHQGSLIPKLHIGSKLFETIFGSNTIDIKPRGTASLKFGMKYVKTDNPMLSEDMRKDFTFKFDERIQMNVTGKIGENLSLKMSYDTEGSFAFEDEMNIRYQGDEDDIIQRIEAGDVSLPINGTLIQGSQNLFGFLTEMKFGKLNITTLFSEQKSESKHIRVEGGAQKRAFKVQGNEYDDNRHYFLAHHFKENYEKALEMYPLISTNTIITELEVWVLNKSSNVENTRNIIAVTDIGENKKIFLENPENIQINGKSYPSNGSNNLYKRLLNLSGISEISSAIPTIEGSLGFQNGKDFELTESARKLQPTEYTLNAQLGYISLNSKLRSDEMLAVAFKVKVRDEFYQVGELTSQGSSAQNTLIVKLIKPSGFSPRHKTWELMMKNIYKLDAYNISRDDFMLNVTYNDVAIGTDVYTLPTENSNLRGINLLKVLNLDRLNSQNVKTEHGDGIFDFAEGITINSAKGYVIFPVLQPFGSYLRSVFGESSQSEADHYAYDELYDSTKTFADQISEKNKFAIQGYYKSASGSEIPLNSINIPKGSVKVTAGGRELTESVDYTVDYYLGRVKILNEGLLQSGTPIDISLESSTLFSIQSKRLMGTTLEYRVNEDLTFGGSILNLTEIPMTKKVSVGSEPISNTIWGFNVNYEAEVPFLTKMVDKIPFIDTKAPSKITTSAEFAHLIPGHNKKIKHKGEAFLDDFEGATSDIPLREPYFWFLASTPKRFTNDYNAAGANIYDNGINRAQMSWYTIDPSFYESRSPVNDNAISSLNTYDVKEQQIFPNRDPSYGFNNSLSVFHLSFFPKERGPYNFDSNETNIASDGTFTNPEVRWAGIQRSLRTSDFEEANIEFVEFWIMDPYAQDTEDGIERDDPNPTLYFNLGNLSEDVLKDGRRSFEHGLPIDGTTQDMEETPWGLVSKRQVSAQGFSDNGRKYQDVGYDGLTNEREYEFFIGRGVFSSSFLSHLTPDVREELEDDPASDDYKYYKGGFYESDPLYKNNITNRYRYFTNPHGNSPTNSGSETQMQTSIPNNEDINKDNTLNQIDAYYEYKIDLSKENFEINKKYIVDENEVNVKMPNGKSKTVTWYQFKIPVREPDGVFGNISDYRSIRFMRMYMTGFNRNVTLRFAQLNLVRSEWRKYLYVLEEGGEVVDDDTDLNNTQFDVGAVNIEENGNRAPINYVLPPDVERSTDPSNSQIRHNEQAISLKVKDLPDGYSKAIYKNIRFDMRQYKRLKMFIHGEKLDNSSLLDNELTVFVRLGTDIKENYYEYEIPIALTPPGNYSMSKGDRKIVWPSENELNIPLSILTETKKERNDQLGGIESGVSLLSEYSKKIGKNTVKVRGNPNLSEIVTFMIGVRNPRSDMRAVSGEIWVNELRLTEFDEKGGWAANARITAQLADLGSVTIAGATSKSGFGSIEQKLNERQLNEIYQYDINTNLQLGEFFPKESGVKIPMYFGYAETFTNPKYNPLSKDIEFDKSLEGLTQTEKKEMKRIAQEYNMRKSLNFTGVRFAKTPKKPHFYNLANISLSYAYTQVYDRNINLAYQDRKQHIGSINYMYSPKNKPWEPFKNSKLSSKYFGLIKGLNLNYAPAQISFSNVISRKYNKMKQRNLNIPDQVFDPNYDKIFTWNRDYGLVYNLSKSIKIDYKAKAASRIYEPEGRVERNMSGYNKIRRDIINDFVNLGSLTDYDQSFNITYQVPINKIPGFQWINLTAGYNGLYDWMRGPEVGVDFDPGHSISNSNRYSGSLTMSFGRLFKKSKYIADLHKKFNKPLKDRFSEKVKYKVKYKKDRINIKAGSEKQIYHKLGTEDVTVKLIDKSGKEIKVNFQVVDDKRIKLKATSAISGASILVTGERERNQSPLIIAGEYLARIATGLKNTQINYIQNNGSIVNGFSKTPTSMGIDFKNTQHAPGWRYTLGISDKDYMQRAIRNKWIQNIDQDYIEPYLMTFSENLTISTTLEPLKGLKIQLKAQTARTRNTERFYYPGVDGWGENVPNNPTSMNTKGNWSMSVWTLGSSFDKIDDKNHTNKNYREFLSNRSVIARRLGEQRDGVLGYEAKGDFPDGFPSYSQDVVVPAFISTYVDGISSDKISLSAINPIYSIFRPDWRIDYDGLMQLAFFKRKFRSLKINHSYKGIFTMGGYQNNPEWSDISITDNSDPLQDGLSFIRSQQDTTMFLTRYSINQITISEDFMPFLEVNMTWKTNVTTRLAFNKSRSMSLNTSNNNIAESHQTEFVIGTGYRFDNLTLVFKTRKGGQRKFNSPVELRADFSVKDDVKYVHKPDDGFTELVNGALVYTLGITGDYKFSKNLDFRVFLDYSMRDPKIEITHKVTEINFGFSFNFRLVDAL